MIGRSKARSIIAGGTPESMTCKIEFEELCCVCDRPVSNGRLILRKFENERIICLICIAEIALAPIE